MKTDFVGVDIGGSKIAVLARSPSGESTYSAKLKTPAQDGVEAILEILDFQLAAAGGPRVRALGVAVPGHVDEDGNVLNAGNLKGWRDVPLREILRKRYRIPVYVEKDANCGALGELDFGAARKLRDFIFLALGTGVGAALVIDRRLYRGAHSVAGEAGDLVIEGETVGDVVGKRAIKKAVKKATGEKLSAAEALARAAKSRRLQHATEKAVDHLRGAVLAMSALFDPEAILFGGGTSGAGPALLSRLREHLRPRLAVMPRLIRAELGADAQLYGALRGAGRAAHLTGGQIARLCR